MDHGVTTAIFQSQSLAHNIERYHLEFFHSRFFVTLVTTEMVQGIEVLTVAWKVHLSSKTDLDKVGGEERVVLLVDHRWSKRKRCEYNGH